MSRFFDWIAPWMPLFIVLVLMGLSLPFRAFVLLLLPPDASLRWHRLNKIYDFVAFQK